MGIFPTKDVQINSGQYLDMLPIAALKDVALAVTGVNVFLNWFKGIAILSYSPTFAVINQTLKTAAPNVASFGWVFFIVFYGFTQAHAMIFNGKVHGFMDLWESGFSLLRALLGDFDFKELQNAERWIGPVFFLLFIANMFFVVLNMLIAIISDAYEVSRSQLKDMQQVDLLKSIKGFLVQRLRKKCCVGCLVRCCCRATYRQIRAEEERAKRTELAAADTAGGSNGMKKDIGDLKHSLDRGLKSVDGVNTGLTQALVLLGTEMDEIVSVATGTASDSAVQEETKTKEETAAEKPTEEQAAETPKEAA